MREVGADQKQGSHQLSIDRFTRSQNVICLKLSNTLFIGDGRRVRACFL